MPRTLPTDDSRSGLGLLPEGRAQFAPQIPSRPGLSHSQRRGMRIGAGIGWVAGAVVGWLLAPEAPDTCVLDCGVEVVASALYAGLGGLSGLVIGGGLGLAVGTVVGDDDGSAYRAAVTFTIPVRPFD